LPANPPADWPVAVYPAKATAFRRDQNGNPCVRLYGRWRKLSAPAVCAMCRRTYFYAFGKQAGVACSKRCAAAFTSERNAASVGSANPHWKGGVSTDRMRYRRRQAEKNPEKERARRLTRAAILSGRLVQKPCEKCGEPKTQAHHDDYSQPLKVRWLCVIHHRQHHGGHATGRVERPAHLPGEAA